MDTSKRLFQNSFCCVVAWTQNVVAGLPLVYWSDPTLELTSHIWPTTLRKNRDFIMMPKTLRMLGTSRKLGEHHNQSCSRAPEKPCVQSGLWIPSQRISMCKNSLEQPSSTILILRWLPREAGGDNSWATDEKAIKISWDQRKLKTEHDPSPWALLFTIANRRWQPLVFWSLISPLFVHLYWWRN